MLETLIRLNEESLGNLYQQRSLKKTIQEIKDERRANYSAEHYLKVLLRKSESRLEDLQSRWAHVQTEMVKIISDDNG